MKKLILLPLAVLLFACNSSSEPTAQEKAKADQESDSIANAADAFLNDTTPQDTNKTK
jgi:hypothetical protein